MARYLGPRLRIVRRFGNLTWSNSKSTKKKSTTRPTWAKSKETTKVFINFRLQNSFV